VSTTEVRTTKNDCWNTKNLKIKKKVEQRPREIEA